MLTLLAIILFLLWLTGAFVVHTGSLIHLLLVIAIGMFLYNAITGRRTGV